jgi:hypothetical protein
MVFLLGPIWLCGHVVLLLALGKLLRVPLFYFAIGSQSNVGGPASAPVVAAAFHPALAPVGVLLGTMATPAAPIGGIWSESPCARWPVRAEHGLSDVPEDECATSVATGITGKARRG